MVFRDRLLRGDFVSARLRIISDPTATAARSREDVNAKLKNKRTAGVERYIYIIIGAEMSFVGSRNRGPSVPLLISPRQYNAHFY